VVAETAATGEAVRRPGQMGRKSAEGKVAGSAEGPNGPRKGWKGGLLVQTRVRAECRLILAAFECRQMVKRQRPPSTVPTQFFRFPNLPFWN
jgi:hypothetical protein